MGRQNVKLELNRDGVRALLKSNEMQAICEEHANAALAKLGEGYEVSSMVGENRCNASVAAVSEEAKRENMEGNTILKAVSSS